MQKTISQNTINVELLADGEGNGDLLEIRFIGKLSGNDVGFITSELEKHLPVEIPNVIVDLSQLSYVNSTGLSLLLTIWKKVINSKKNIVFFQLHPFMHELFSMTELNSKFDIVADRSAAVEKIHSA